MDSATVSGRTLANTGVVVLEGPDESGWRLVDWREEIAGDLNPDPVAPAAPTL